MSETLQKHINKFVRISEKEFTEILTYFTLIKAAKKEDLLVAGKTCKSNYFVSEGCLRLFFVNDKGIEETIQFALEHWWLSDYTSFSTQKPAEFSIQAVEKSEVMALSFSAQEEMLQRFPQMERYFRLVHQRAHAAFQFRIKFLYTMSREQLYREFARQYPAFVQRIPQYLLASFLGLTPEYLSEIRSKKIS